MRRYKVEVKGKEYVVYINEISASLFRVIVDDKIVEVKLNSEQDLAESLITPEIIPTRPGTEEVIERPAITYSPPSADVFGQAPKSPTPPQPPRPTLSAGELRLEITSPMPGVIQTIHVKPGEVVKHGQPLLVLEAMKMKNSIKSPRDGTVALVMVSSGQCVSYGDVLIKFEQEEQS